MKSYKILTLTLLCAATLVGCNKDDQAPARGGELKLSPTTQQIEPNSRALGSSFFTNGDSINVNIVDRGYVNPPLIYTYKNGSFTGINYANTYHFYMDDKFITSIVAVWPTNRPTAPISDQRLFSNFKRSDYMTATLQNVEATKEYVPINFKRENAKITFMVEGQSVVGDKITSLVVDVDHIGFHAYANPVTGFAELILPPGPVDINADNIAGLITIGGYTGSVIFGMTTTYTLVANTSYVVTLTPRGDFMLASISIGGWYQGEDGIGVPLIFSNGAYQISTEAQLFAIAHLTNNHKPDAGNVNWAAANYTLTGNIARTTPLRPWTTLTNYTGVFDYNGFSITPSIVFSYSIN